MTRADTQTRLEHALTRLLAGQPTSSDGALTISSLCREADVGRDSYYRSPQQFKDTVVAAFARREAQQPELVTLREENAALKREKKQIVQENARAVRELEKHHPHLRQPDPGPHAAKCRTGRPVPPTRRP